MNAERVYHLALRDLHSAAGAHFGTREGWSVPLEYGDWLAEHAALRGAAAAFDRSWRSRFMVTGTDALEVLKAAFAGHVDEVEEGRAMRTVALDAGGTIADLVLIVRTGGIAYLVSGEASRRAETFARLTVAAGGDWDVRVDDRTETTCAIGLAGPAAASAAERYLSAGLRARLPLLGAVTFEFHGFRTLVVRASDTGEDGFEFIVAPAVAHHIIETLGAAGLGLAGWAALEAARVEACIPAFIPDLEPGLSPAEADVDVLLEVPGGREGRILAAVLFDGDGSVVPGTAVRSDGAAVGEVRSCVYSPSLRAVVGLALIDSRRAVPGAALDADGIRGTIVAKPFYRRRG
jgi:aminomethyltransferase